MKNWLLVLFGFCFSVFADAQSNSISIVLNSESYDCSTGQVTFSFHISNTDALGNSGNFHTVYDVNAGISSITNQSVPAGEPDLSFTGAYHLGDNISITAHGISNNGAPLTEYDFVATSPAPPAMPTISSSAAMPLCNGASTILTASGSNGNYTWSTGSTSSSVTVSASGTYSVHASDNCGVSPDAGYTVVAASSPSAPVISNNSEAVLCNGASALLTSSVSAGGIINWSNGASGVNISVNAAGSYYASESNVCGTSGNSNVIVITTNNSPSAPTVSSSAGNFLCDGQSTILSASPSAGGTINWSTGASGNSITVSSAGNYYAYESNNCGAGANSNIISIAIGATPAAPTVSPSGNQTLCNGASINLSATGTNITWSNGATGNSISVSAAGNYFAYDHNSCGNSVNSNAVTVSTVVCPIPSPGSNFSVCPGTLKMLDAGAGYDSYAWSDGETTRTINVGPGTYSVTVTRQGCSATSAAVTVSYYTVVTPTISVSGATTFCSGGSVVLTASSGSGYAWSNGATSNPITVSSSGAYYVTVTDGNGCQATSAATNITVNALPAATIAGNAAVCQNSAAPSVTFTGSGGVAPYAFVYKVNGGANQSVSTTSGNSVSISVPTNTTGSLSYSLVSVQESSSTSCVGSASGTATIVVNPLPSAVISGSTTVCQNSSSPAITFTGSGGTAPHVFTYSINGGANQIVSTTSGNSVTVAVPTNVPGTFVYSLQSVQESSGTSCNGVASGTATVVVNPSPSAVISGSSTVCQNSATPVITFTGSGGIAPYHFVYKINGGADQSISTTSGNSVTLAVPTNSAGTFVYSLVSVSESSGVSCSGVASGTATVVVNPLPSAVISGTSTVCQNSGPRTITFSGIGGTAPYTFTYTINGGAVQTITTNSGNSIGVSVPTNVAGTFTYSLVSVQDGSSTSCNNSVSGTATVVVNPLPSAVISGNTTICQNGISPVVTFSGSNGTAPYTFIYSINGGTNQRVTTASGNSASISVPTTNTGNFTYDLVSVQDASNTACINAASGSITVTINPAPANAAITAGSNHLCNGESAILTITNYTAGFTYTWYKDGVLLTTTTTNTISVTQAGSYTVMVTSDKGCNAAAVSNAIIITTGSVSTPVITGYLHVCPQGKTKLFVQPSDSSLPYEAWRWTDTRDTSPGRVLLGDSSFSAFAGQYRVVVLREGCADSAFVAITPDDTEFPAGQLIISPNAVAYGGQVKLFADVTGSVQYSWDLGDGNTIADTSRTIFENYYIGQDSVRIKVKAISERNCQTTFTGTLKVSAIQTQSIPNRSFAGNLKDWNVFPTPFHDHLKVSVILIRNETVRLDLFTADGKWVRSWTPVGVKGENLFVLDGIETLGSGAVYLITGYYNNEKHFDKVFKY